MLSFRPTKTPLIFYLLLVVISSAVTFFITRSVLSNTIMQPEVTGQGQLSDCSFRIKRLSGYGMVQPILFVESSCESENLQSLKNEISNTIAGFINDGTLISASVYLRDFAYSEWISINSAETYSPGSMLKLPILITYLKMSEGQPGLLDKYLAYDKPYEGTRKAVNISESIKPGGKYRIRELLRYMIWYSDNNATYLLNEHMDASAFTKVFADFGLDVPDRNAKSYPMNVKDLSKFMRALFNASYLSKEDSEYALELLTGCNFDKGIAKGVPPATRVSHKFGEEGTAECPQLHESAIVYLDNGSYLLTIMTMGHDMEKQTQVLSAISSRVYEAMSSMN